VAISISGSIAPIIYATILAQKSVPGLPGVPAESQFFLAFIVNASIDIFCAVICFSSLLKVRQRPGPVGAVQRP
jgi:hypothetical protein